MSEHREYEPVTSESIATPTIKIKCRQCQDTGLLPGAADGGVCICLFGARLLHAAKYPDVKRCENCNCVAPPCSYALTAGAMMAPYTPEPLPSVRSPKGLFAKLLRMVSP